MIDGATGTAGLIMFVRQFQVCEAVSVKISSKTIFYRGYFSFESFLLIQDEDQTAGKRV